MGKRYAVKMLSLLQDTPTRASPEQAIRRYGLGEPHLDGARARSLTFEIPNSAFVSLKVFSTQGQEVAELAGRRFAAGRHTVAIGKGTLSMGIHIVTMETGDYTATRKFLFGGP
jgi:hypothetical protein